MICYGLLTILSYSHGRYGSLRGLSNVDDCSRCAQGRYGTETGATTKAQCKACPTGRIGTSATGLQLVTQCLVCTQGYYQPLPDGAVTCTPCLKGRYGVDDGAKAGDAVALAAMRSQVNTACVNCPKGRFGATPGLQSMSSCTYLLSFVSLV